MNRSLFLFIILGVYVFNVYSRSDTVPTWLDTIPPQVTVMPKVRYHATPFYISLKANENATIWVGIDSSQNMQPYTKNISISKAGRTIVYFYAEDIYGNKSVQDTVHYTLDFQPPRLTIQPDPGMYKSAVTLQISCSEPCRLFRHVDPSGKDKVPIKKKVIIQKAFLGYISAVDRAGNITRSNELQYIVDTSSIRVSVQPVPGIYNYPVIVSFKATAGADIYYTFDANAPSKWFTRYNEPAQCPYGLTLLRYFARNKTGNESAIMSARFVVDTVPPKIRHMVTKGETSDVLMLSTKDNSEIRYALNNTTSFENSTVYKRPMEFPHKGRAYVKALARDKAGNMSRRFIWDYKYDKIPPAVRPSHVSSVYTKPFTLTFATSEPAKVLYTINDKPVDENSLVYQEGIRISKKGITTVRYVGVDNADNRSEEGRVELDLDFSPPKIRARIEMVTGKDEFYVVLQTSETARIYYERGSKTPTTSSPVYTKKISMKTGQILRYFATDNAGNRTDIIVMDDLQKPMVSVTPPGGVYRSRVPLHFTRTMATDIYWRLLPDTLFQLFQDSIIIGKEGVFTVEYYSLSPAGFKSPVRRLQYVIDWTPPRIEISVKKGVKDSVSVFFEASENASIYYTIDGTSPFFSRTTQIAGNKFTKSRDRISISRAVESKLAFFAEDIAGNQGSISVLDIFKPRAIPNIPHGTKRVNDRVLSLSLNTYDDRSQIYFERHGIMPTLESTLYTEPITLVQSDTIKTFVIDASGYKGEIETFIYLIDLPPSPHVTLTPDVADIDKVVTFNASGTLDQESHASALTYAWDFNGDGTVDLEKKGEPIVTHVYRKPGKYQVTLEVVDPSKRSAKISHELLVRGICPQDMVFVPRGPDRSFCVDKYEWPNKKGKVPLVSVSWIRAKMYCYDVGKRLCTAEEWQYACSGRFQKKIQGTTLGRYPYGSHYETEKCPTEGEKVYKSGGFNHCKERFGTYDMLGNVWEWVADKKDGAPVIVGGSYTYGQKAHCGLSSESSLSGESVDTGFRCCR